MNLNCNRRLLCCAGVLMALLLSACGPSATGDDSSLDGNVTTTTQNVPAIEDEIEWDETDDTSNSQTVSSTSATQGTTASVKQSGFVGSTSATTGDTTVRGTSSATVKDTAASTTDGTTTTRVTTAPSIDNDGYGPIVKP